ACFSIAVNNPFLTSLPEWLGTKKPKKFAVLHPYKGNKFITYSNYFFPADHAADGIYAGVDVTKKSPTLFLIVNLFKKKFYRCLYMNVTITNSFNLLIWYTCVMPGSISAPRLTVFVAMLYS